MFKLTDPSSTPPHTTLPSRLQQTPPPATFSQMQMPYTNLIDQPERPPNASAVLTRSFPLILIHRRLPLIIDHPHLSQQRSEIPGTLFFIQHLAKRSLIHHSQPILGSHSKSSAMSSTDTNTKTAHATKLSQSTRYSGTSSIASSR